MNPRIPIVVALLFLISIISGAQDKSSGKTAATGYKNSGFMLITGIGLLANNTSAGISLSAVAGSQVNEHQSIGLGIGCDTYDNDSATAIPIFVDLRAYFLDGDLKPFIVGDAGYSFLSREGHEGGGLGGLVVRAGGGLKIFIGTDFAFYFDCSYKYQMASTTTKYILNYNLVESESSTSYQSLLIEIGLSF